VRGWQVKLCDLSPTRAIPERFCGEVPSLTGAISSVRIISFLTYLLYDVTVWQVLGILFAVFVACYLPFFAVYVVKGTCGEPCRPYLTPRVLIALEWLAYSGSMLNPIIYHVFNPDFRRAFDTLLRCGCCRPGFGASRQRQGTAAGSFAGGRASVAARRPVAGGGASGLGVMGGAMHRQSAIDIPTYRVDAV